MGDYLDHTLKNLQKNLQYCLKFGNWNKKVFLPQIGYIIGTRNHNYTSRFVFIPLNTRKQIYLSNSFEVRGLKPGYFVALLTQPE